MDRNDRARANRRLAAVLVGCAAALALPATAGAAVTIFGSDLSLPATLNTAANIPPANHAGADNALWNIATAGTSPTAPASGQILTVKVKGCAESASGAPTTSTEIHFQDLVPQADGSFKVNVTTQPFNLPICGAAVNGNTVTTFSPTNFCVAKGDYVDFNDNGGFDPNFYPHGVPLMVLGSRSGSTLDSFIRHNGTDNGDTFAPGDVTSFDGFGQSAGEELLLQAAVGTDLDGEALCPGGGIGVPAAPVIQTSAPPTAVTTVGATFSATINPHGRETNAYFQYGADLGFGYIAQAFTDYTHSTPEEEVGTDFTDHDFTAVVTDLIPNATYHWRVVVTNGSGTVYGPDQSFRTGTDPPPPPPVLGKSVDIQAVSGIVFVKPPRGATITAEGVIARSLTQKGQGFIPLTEARQIPVGSILDTTKGVARLTTATTSRLHHYYGNFSAGVFKLLQNRTQKGLTNLTLMDGLSRAKVCTPLGKHRDATAAKTLSNTVLGLLKSKVRGSFSTRGAYSGATVRGTEWSITDTCAGTITKVTRGSVVVEDFRLHRTILVGAGHSYLARASGAAGSIGK